MMTNKKHSSLCLDGLHQLKKDKKFCDVTIEADGSQFHVHRAVLASCSPYFYAMFCSEMEESKKSVISIREIPANAMETILEYCYTAKIDINEESVQYLLPAASLLQMGWVRDSCCEFLKNQLCSFNCLGVRAFADTHDCHELCNAATTFAQQNYLEVLEAEEFLELDFDKLVELIRSDDLNITSEEQVYESVIKWVKHDIDTRYVKLPQILEHVRLPLLDKHYLVNVVGTEALIRKSAECRDLLDDAKDYLLIPEQRVKLSGPRTRPRKPMKTNETLFAVGGWCNGDAISMVEQYDTESKKWKEVAHMSKRRCGVGIAVVDSLLYAIGGHDGGSYLNSIERFDPKTNSWSSDVAPTSSCRTSVGVAVLDGKIYAVGGQDGISCLSIVECYDPTTNTWSHVTSMNTHRLGVAVGVLGGCLYAVGGSDGSSPLNTVERYDRDNNQWSFVAPMKVKRKHLGVAVVNDFLYAVGGRDEQYELSSVERYDPNTDSWTSVVAMNERRSGLGLCIFDNKLYSIGGFNGTCYLKSVEWLDPTESQWHFGSSMNYKRLGCGVGVLSTIYCNELHQIVSIATETNEI